MEVNSEKLLSLAKEIVEHWNPAGGEWNDPKMTPELFDALEDLVEFVENMEGWPSGLRHRS